MSTSENMGFWMELYTHGTILTISWYWWLAAVIWSIAMGCFLGPPRGF